MLFPGYSMSWAGIFWGWYVLGMVCVGAGMFWGWYVLGMKILGAVIFGARVA